MITALVIVALFYKVVAVVGWLLYYKLRRERYYYTHHGSKLGAAFTRSHESHAADNAYNQRVIEELRAKLTTDSLMDAFWLAVERTKGPGGGVLGYEGPQPPRSFAKSVADILAEPDYLAKRKALAQARFRYTVYPDENDDV